jgi:cell division septal protein FtsQ
MFTKIINKIKHKVKKNKFKETLKKEKRKVFIDTPLYKSKFSKRKKQITFKLPKFQNNYIKNNGKLVYLSVFFIIILLFVASLFTPVFSIKKINITLYNEQDGLIDLNIAYNLVSYYRGKNNIFLDKNEIKEQLVNYQKNIDRIEINKTFFPA